MAFSFLTVWFTIDTGTVFMRNGVIVIPAYQPNHKLIYIAHELKQAGFPKIIVVDDGSGPEYQTIFSALEIDCKVIHHEQNQGKGAALKTGYCYYLTHIDEYPWVIAMDADGQHSVDDVIKMDDTMANGEEGVYIGVRDLNDENFPPSRKAFVFATRLTFKSFYGTDIKDTESGLRGIYKVFLPFMLDASGERFEYETNALMEAIHYHFPSFEVPIQTIFFKEDNVTHFNPVRDALKTQLQLFREFIKYSITSLIASAIDIAIYTVLNLLFGKLPDAIRIFGATIVARIISATANYMFNRQVVFQCHENNGPTMVKYFLMVIIQMICSATMVYFLSKVVSIPSSFIKIATDTILFFVFYRVQKLWVFKN